MLGLSRILLVGLIVPSAAMAQGTPADATFFEQKVRPLLVEHCYSCHSASAKKVKGGLLLDSREAILKGGDSGPAAVVGQPDNSALIRAVRYKDTELQMPPKGRLSDREVGYLEQWVRGGLAFPASTAKAGATKKVDVEAGRKFWSFQPLRRTDPPAVKAAWPKRPIDNFVLAELEKRGMEPGGPAIKAALIRRAKFDLVGLPPTPEEVDAFVRDANPDAFANFIDRWLASPQYGDRWGRYWLDLARYCDVSEAWSESKGQPHLYRDWVIRAFNEDIPYPRFLALQLAADQTPDARPGDQAALGFIGLSPTYWKELQLPVEIIKTIVSDEYEERLHTLSSTFLGLNVACARCHDHKFDPITNEDYYALAGVFASTKLADRSLVRGCDGEKVSDARKEVAKLEEEIKKLAGKKDLVGKAEELQKKVAQLKATPGYDAPLAPGVRDATLEVVNAVGTHGSRVIYNESSKDMPVEIRGNPNKPGPVVPRRFVSVLSPGTPARFTHGSGRRELAEAMVRDAGPLLARVIVNRVWRLHFGVGLVETPSDFGAQGDRPSHPELLDDLAARFVEAGWSLKWLHREVMLSATYQQAGGVPASADPGGRFYSRFPRRRLDVEAWRDAMMQVSGTLDQSMGGPAAELNVATNHRRTVYGLVRRRELTDLLRLHDFPDPVTHSAGRVPTITPLQQLFTLNSPLMAETATALAGRLQKDAGDKPADRIERAYRLLFGRQPSQKELSLGLAFVGNNDPAAWRQYAQVLLGSNEFQFID